MERSFRQQHTISCSRPEIPSKITHFHSIFSFGTLNCSSLGERKAEATPCTHFWYFNLDLSFNEWKFQYCSFGQWFHNVHHHFSLNHYLDTIFWAWTPFYLTKSKFWNQAYKLVCPKDLYTSLFRSKQDEWVGFKINGSSQAHFTHISPFHCTLATISSFFSFHHFTHITFKFF